MVRKNHDAGASAGCCASASAAADGAAAGVTAAAGGGAAGAAGAGGGAGAGASGPTSATIAGRASGFSCAPRSKTSPGPGWIFVVGERGATCVIIPVSSSTGISRPAFADSPRITISRSRSRPLGSVRISSCVSHVSSGIARVTVSSTRTTGGYAYLRSST